MSGPRGVVITILEVTVDACVVAKKYFQNLTAQNRNVGLSQFYAHATFKVKRKLLSACGQRRCYWYLEESFSLT